MLNIVFLDSYTLNPGDLTWELLEEIGHFTIFERTVPEQVIERSKDADVLLINKVKLNATHFALLPKLKLICVAAAGYDVVDVKAARDYGITVCNASGYGNNAVAQMVVAHILNVTNRVGYYAQKNREGFWAKSIDFCVWDNPLTELNEKSVAILGFGNIGQAVARMLQAFGMRIFAISSKPSHRLPTYVTKISLEEAVKTCDILSINCPLTNENRGLINAALLKQAQPNLLIINTARGGIINEQDLTDALYAGKIKAYCADVLAQEPPSENNPLLSAPNSFITPHIAWATVEARNRIIQILKENIESFKRGEKLRVVN